MHRSEYFKYHVVTTADLFQLFGMGHDMKNTIPQMALDFWYVLVIFILPSFLLIIFYNRIKVITPSKIFGEQGTAVVACFAFAICVCYRFASAFQYKPMNIMGAARFTTPQLVPLVLNTPFTVLKTMGKSNIDEKNYFSSEERGEFIFQKDHNYKSQKQFKP